MTDRELSIDMQSQKSERWLSLENYPNEEWRDVVGFEGLYQVSNIGRVKALPKKRFSSDAILQAKILRSFINPKGYYMVKLYKDSIQKTIPVHRVVITAFTPNLENKPQIDHINAVKYDNRVCNLRWVTNKENSNNPITKRKLLGRTSPMKGKTGEKASMYGIKGKLNHKSIPIVAVSLKDGSVTHFENANLLREKGFSHSCIRKKCVDADKFPYKGYLWYNLSDYEKPEIRQNIDALIKRGNVTKLYRNRKKVAMCDINTGDVIKVFDSITNVSTYLNMNTSNVGRMLNNNKMKNGYLWKRL